MEAITSATLKMIFMFAVQAYTAYNPTASFPTDITPPPVYYAEHNKVQELGGCIVADCKIIGWYTGFSSEERSIYLSNKYPEDKLATDPYAQSIVFHENIHYLQQLDGKTATTCEDGYKIEREAYALQSRFLQRRGVPIQLGIPSLQQWCNK
jgi:hypothetical protein